MSNPDFSGRARIARSMSVETSLRSESGCAPIAESSEKLTPSATLAGAKSLSASADIARITRYRPAEVISPIFAYDPPATCVG